MVSVADEHIGTPSLWQYSPSTASAVLTAIVGATAALTGFVVTVTVLVVQMATGTFSARIMRLWFRDRILKVTLAVLVGTLTFSFAVLQRIDDDSVPDIGVTLSGFFISLCLLVFIVFFDRFIRRLRPVAVAAGVASVARSTFTRLVRIADRPDIRWEYVTARGEPTHVVRASRGGAIQAVDPDGLVEWARAHRAELVLPQPVGDFVHTGGELVRVYGGEFGDRAAAELEGMVALGDERTFDQDPAFAIRMMVDIANRALSPAVNDPTTAVQVLDHIEEVLDLVGRTDFEQRTKEANDDATFAVCHQRTTVGRTSSCSGSPSSDSMLRRCRSCDDSERCSRNFSRRYGSSIEQRSKKSSAVSMPPSPTAGATRSTSIARPGPTAKGSVVRRTARRATAGARPGTAVWVLLGTTN